MKGQIQIKVTKRSPAYWRVTFDHPPLNIFGPEMLPQVNEINSLHDRNTTPKHEVQTVTR